jgi:hypothetical protein
MYQLVGWVVCRALSDSKFFLYISTLSKRHLTFWTGFILYLRNQQAMSELRRFDADILQLSSRFSVRFIYEIYDS